MNEITSHLKQIQRAFEGEAWHGPALLESLEGVNAHMAKRRWVDGVHSIWEIALHTVAWKRAVTLWLQGEQYKVEEDENFPSPDEGDETEWQHVLTTLKVAQAELLAVVARLTNEQLYETPPPWRKTITSDYLFGIVHHDLYHAGQIALLKKSAQVEMLGSKVK